MDLASNLAQHDKIPKKIAKYLDQAFCRVWEALVAVLALLALVHEVTGMCYVLICIA